MVEAIVGDPSVHNILRPWAPYVPQMFTYFPNTNRICWCVNVWLQWVSGTLFSRGGLLNISQKYLLLMVDLWPLVHRQIVMLGSKSAGFQSLRGILVRSAQSSDSDCANGFESSLFSHVTNFIWSYLHHFFDDSHGLKTSLKPLRRPFDRCQSRLKAINNGRDIKQINW